MAFIMFKNCSRFSKVFEFFTSLFKNFIGHSPLCSNECLRLKFKKKLRSVMVLVPNCFAQLNIQISLLAQVVIAGHLELDLLHLIPTERDFF